MSTIAERCYSGINHLPAGDEGLVSALILASHTMRDTAITRAELCEKTGFGDRKVRKIIARLVNHYGLPIGSCSHVAGYYLIDNEADAQAAARELVKKAKSLLYRANRGLNSRHLANALGQMELYGEEHNLKYRVGDMVYSKHSNRGPQKISKAGIRKSDGAYVYGLEGQRGLYSEDTLTAANVDKQLEM